MWIWGPLRVPWAKIMANIVFSTTAQMVLFHPQKFCVLHFMFCVSSLWVYPTCCPQKSLPISCSPVMWLTNKRCTILSAQLRTGKQHSHKQYPGYCWEWCRAFQIDVQKRLKGSYRRESSWISSQSFLLSDTWSFIQSFLRGKLQHSMFFCFHRNVSSFWTFCHKMNSFSSKKSCNTKWHALCPSCSFFPITFLGFSLWLFLLPANCSSTLKW